MEMRERRTGARVTGQWPDRSRLRRPSPLTRRVRERNRRCWYRSRHRDSGAHALEVECLRSVRSGALGAPLCSPSDRQKSNEIRELEEPPMDIKMVTRPTSRRPPTETGTAIAKLDRIVR